MNKKTRENSVFSGLLQRILKIKELGILITLIILFVAFSLLSNVFCTSSNLLNVIRQVSIMGTQALGMTMVIAVGGVDLSVGSVYALSTTAAAVLMTQSNIPIVWCCLMGILVGFAFGALNGFIIGYMNIPPFIATMGTMNIARGLALILTNGMIISLDRSPVADPENLETFLKIGGGNIKGIPNLAIVFLALCVLAFLFFHRTLSGFRMKAVGGNMDAARASGINVKRIIVLPYIITGVLCALTGILNFSFMHTVQGTMGEGMELDVLAAAYIGGASPSGGYGTIIGTVIGVLIMGVLKNGLVLLGVNAYVQKVVIGILVIGAVVIDMYNKSKRK